MAAIDKGHGGPGGGKDQASCAVFVKYHSEITKLVNAYFKTVLILLQALEWSPPKML